MIYTNIVICANCKSLALAASRARKEDPDDDSRYGNSACS